MKEIRENVLNYRLGCNRQGYHWTAYDISSDLITNDFSVRLDYKYWEPQFRKTLNDLQEKNCLTIKDLSMISISRGSSPNADCYVDEKDGYALVIKAGSNIGKFGNILKTSDSDWIEKSLYDEYLQRAKDKMENKNIVKKGDVLLASTGDGTLGKCCVYTEDIPAIADGHVTIIRVNTEIINPYYLADYLRCGFGKQQIISFYSGSTGLIELTPEQVAAIVVDHTGDKKNLEIQQKISNNIREKEKAYIKQIQEAENMLLSIDTVWG